MKSNSLRFSDIFFNVFDKITTMLITFFWRIFLGEIGRGSYVHKGLSIIGNPKNIVIGVKFKIWNRCILSVGKGKGKGKIEFGNNGLLGVNSYINASKCNVKIGNNVAIAPFCQIYSYSHNYSQYELSVNNYNNKDVSIEDNVLIGSNVVILPGVTIHKGAVIAASSVVNRDVAENSIVGGVPIKIISERK